MPRGARPRSARLSGRWPGRTRCSWSARRCCTCCGRGGCGRTWRRPLGAGTPVRLAAGAGRDERPGAGSIAPGSRLSSRRRTWFEVVAGRRGWRSPPATDRTRRFTAVLISRLAASGPSRRAGPFGPVMTACHPGSRSASLTSEQLDPGSAEQAGHVREVLTGYKSGHRGPRPGPGEPRPGYRAGAAAEGPLPGQGGRTRGSPSRTVERWVAAYRGSGEAGLAGLAAGAARPGHDGGSPLG